MPLYVKQLTLLIVSILLNLGLSGWVKKYALYDAKVPEDQKLIALTFDDGPHGTLTPKLLDIFKAKGIRATFFVMGVKVGMHPDIIKRARDEGHEIANHAWNHPVLSKLTLPQVQDQLFRTNEIIKTAMGAIPGSMRPPYGNTNDKLNRFMTEDLKLPVIMWSLDTQDWKRPGAKNIITRTVKRVKNGDVILCHDIHPGTIEAMPELVDQLLSKGFKFATVTEILAIDAKTRSAAAGAAETTQQPKRYLRGSVNG